MSDVYFKYKNELEPAKGRVLISEPHLPDTNFDRTVVLLCEHNDEGSFGFVLNKTSRVTLGELLEDGKDLSMEVGVGGPVEQNTLHFLHGLSGLEGAVNVGDDLFMGGDFNLLLDKFNSNSIDAKEVKFYLGYSGWGAGQLLEEIELNSWIVYEPKNLKEILNTDANDMWAGMLNEMGGRYSMYSKYPADPRLN